MEARNLKYLINVFKQILVVGLVLVLTVSNVTPADAAGTVIADNLNNEYGGQSTINRTAWVAQAFTTTASNYAITSIQVRLSKDPGATGSYVIQIYSNTGGKPNAKVADVVTNGNVATLADTQYSASPIVTSSPLAIKLAANTTYFLVIGSTNLDSFSIYWDAAMLATGIGFPSNYTASNDGGVNWDPPSIESPSQMKISAADPTAVTLAQFGAKPGLDLSAWIKSWFK